MTGRSEIRPLRNNWELLLAVSFVGDGKKTKGTTVGREKQQAMEFTRFEKRNSNGTWLNAPYATVTWWTRVDQLRFLNPLLEYGSIYFKKV
jgi:hypothetical protein